MKNVEKKFRKWSKEHCNFMTPDLLKVVVGHNYIIEVTKGNDFSNKTIFGVSLFKNNSSFSRYPEDDFSECVESLVEVNRKIVDFKGNLPLWVVV